jgi:integrase
VTVESSRSRASDGGGFHRGWPRGLPPSRPSAGDYPRRHEPTDLPRIRFHDLRHTHASLLVAAGVPIKVVSERLGHATPR